MSPHAVIYPAGDDDIIAAIAYAEHEKVGIAIRTGGHHYTGASSTTGKNIQLDLNDTYTDFILDSNDSTIVTVGISTTLIKFMDKLREHKLFIPAGQCSYVNLGGHVQTGGYGHLIRSFGLFSDHVKAVRIITANGQIQWVRRGVAAEKELFFALLGGSPGNFAVITDLQLKVHRDQDHPHSRGLFGKVPYTPQLFKALVDVMVAEDETDEQPADFDYSLTVVSARPAEDKLHAGIVVFVQWANLEGKGQTYDPSFFQKIKKIIGVPLIPHEGSALDDKAPMSTLCSFWVFPIAREFQLPYFKRTYITESRTLEQDGWSSWVTGRLNEFVLDSKDCHYVSAQYTYLGGKHSRFRIQDPNDDMSFSWRRDSTFVCTMDVFYDTKKNPTAKETAREWVEKNDAEGVGSENGKYSKEDRRLLWGSRDTDLPAAHAHYYDSEAKYQALVKTKKKVDPKLIFTANKFAVGDYRPESRITGRPSEAIPIAG
ncbi:hypothetical protein GALMADRAFT_126419 [Galerina marginata CBS 339.88]|uniref:FAD-binding PCMH-type domain-containing protein n=1 Tax=Galerina marginata (strain CBS 339.88) TaxID=685588 RepID=A0A067SYI0_GALM3|nr:hypothetical protein GALMADRAFT_126419 [Galerina marginata CBS 339.88]